ncbi:hypothetical protein OROGR_028143 [Orobanche gracilis]
MESLRLPHQTIKQNTQTELSEIIPIKTGCNRCGPGCYHNQQQTMYLNLRFGK